MSSKKPKIQFVDAPPGAFRRGRPTDYTIPNVLRERPSEWALIGRYSSKMANAIKIGQGRWAPAGAFEAVSRNQDKGGRADIYVRFIGKEAA